MTSYLRRIASDLINAKNSFSCELFGGSPGISIFLANFSKFSGEEKYLNKAIILIENAINDIHYQTPLRYNFSMGVAGLAWTIDYLNQHDFLDIRATDIFENLEETLIAYCTNQFSLKKFDVLHEGGGVLLYLISLWKREGVTKNNAKIIEDCIEEFIDKCEQSADQIYWKKWLYKEETFVEDISQSHGMASLIVLFTKLLSINFFSDNRRIIKARDGLINYVLAQELNDKSIGCYFSLIPGEQRFGRLAWCYGDLGISRALLFTAYETKNDALMEKALHILSLCAQRRSLENNGVFDASICHGTAGNAVSFMLPWHISKKLNRQTLSLFKSAEKYWIKQTLRELIHEDGIGGYKYRGKNGMLQNEPGFLEGSSGVGLALLTHLDKDIIDWTQILSYQ